MGDTWSEDTPTFTQVTATLKILGGDADVDHYLARTRSNVQDLEAAVVALKAKAVQQAFDDTFINGDTGGDANSFDGIDEACAAGQTISVGDDGGALTLARLDELIDLVRGGKPNLLLMSRLSMACSSHGATFRSSNSIVVRGFVACLRRHLPQPCATPSPEEKAIVDEQRA